MKKKMVAAGLAAGLVAGAGAGLLLELSGSAGAASPATATSDTLAGDTATDESGTDGSADHAARLQEVLQPLVDDGTLTQAQADAVIAALEAAGPGDRMGHGGRGAHLDTVAALLGLTEDEVRTALEGGQTLADLATANGSSAQAVIDAILAEQQTHLDEEVAEGDLTQEEADTRLAEATTAVTDWVNNGGMPAFGRGMGDGGMGGPGGHGPRGDSTSGDSTTDDSTGSTATSNG